MLIDNNFCDNFIKYSCINSCEIKSTFRNFEKITVSCEIGMNFVIFNVWVTYYIGKHSIKHINITKPTRLKNIFSRGSNGRLKNIGPVCAR